MKRKQVVMGLTAAALMTAAAAPAAWAAEVTGFMTLTVGSSYLVNNGTSAPIDAQGTTPVVESPGYTLLPLRGVVEAMGGTLTWNQTTGQIGITLSGQTWTLTIGSTLAVNQYGQTQTMAVAPRLTADGRTLVHIRALELFPGVTCTWNNTTQQVYVSYTVIDPVEEESGPEGQTLLILTNETGETIDGVKWSAADSSSYSANLMQSALLGDDETEYVWLDLEGDIAINLKVTYADGGNEVYEDVDLTAVDEAFALSIQDDGDYDEPETESVPDMEDGLTVYLHNESGVDDIAEAYLYPVGEDYEDYDDVVYEEHDENTLAEGDSLRFTLDAAEDEHLWELYLVYDDDTEAWIEDISLAGASDEVTIVVTGEDEAYRVLDDNSIELEDDASYDEITARIYNDLGDDYTITSIQASPADEDDWYTVWDDDLDDSDYISEDFDLYADGTAWDFEIDVYDAYYDETYTYDLYVDFDDASDDIPYLYIAWYDEGEELDYFIE